MWTTQLILLAGLVALAAAATDISSRIVNGQATTIEEHPYQLSLEYEQEHFCGAVLIRRNVALTGAHCFDTEGGADYKNNYRLRVGTSHRNEGGQLATIQDLAIHPQWDNSTYNYDVAVMLMCNCFDYSPSFYRVDLVPANAFIPEGTIGTITGYGRLSYQGEWAPILQKVDIPVVSLERCREVYSGMGVSVTDAMFCAGSFTGEFDSCGGDNGGPLVSNGMLIGLVSWGNGCAEYGYPGVYTRISHVRPWIDQQFV